MLKRSWTKLKQAVFSPRPLPTRAEIQQRLMTAFDFQVEDLEANRCGVMSRRQHYWFVDRFLRTIFAAIVVIALFGLWLYNTLNHPVFSSGIDVFLPAFALAVAVIAAVFVVWNMFLDIVRRKIATISGIGIAIKAHKSFSYYLAIYDESDLGTVLSHYRLRRGSTRFMITNDQRVALVDGERYTIYYALHSRVIFAVEID
ncbi:MAG: hypothetical protein U0528_09870 [Anaerolineae bacterium]